MLPALFVNLSFMCVVRQLCTTVLPIVYSGTLNADRHISLTLIASIYHNPSPNPNLKPNPNLNLNPSLNPSLNPNLISLILTLTLILTLILTLLLTITLHETLNLTLNLILIAQERKFIAKNASDRR